MRRNILIGALGAGLLCACGIPPYHPAATDMTARVRFVKFDRPDMCVAGHRVALPRDSNGDVRVPAGRLLHLTGFYRSGSGQCFPAVKFVPQAGQTYDVANDVRAEHCIVNVLRHDASAQYGLRVEPSVNATDICRN